MYKMTYQTARAIKRRILAPVKRARLAKMQNKPSRCVLTCHGRLDGVGGQVCGHISTQLFAHEMGLPYVHSPFRIIGHQAANDNEWVPGWEAFFNLGDGERKIADIAKSITSVERIQNFMEIDIRRDCLYQLNHCNSYANEHVNSLKLFMPGLRTKYHAAGKSAWATGFDPAFTHAAIHVRRGDVNAQAYPGRFTDNDKILKIITNLKTCQGSKQLVIHIYSEGNIEDFQVFAGAGCELHINECPFKTFHSLVSADILVTAKSSFSYAAALYSEGMTIYEPYVQHEALADWVQLDKKGNFDLQGERL